MAASSPSPSPSPPNPSATAGDGDASPSPLPLPDPPAPPPSSSRRPPPPCWTHDETLALIDSYREKWYALRRGNLRAPHWQEVADAVARRCLRLPSATPKTSVQCRHKVEKLRKRYRADRRRSLANDPSAPPTSSWIYFRKLDAMEHGPARAPSPPSPSSSSNDDPSDSGGNTRNVHRLIANGGGLRFAIPKAVRSKIDRVGLGSSPNPNPNTRFVNGYGVRPAAEEMRRRLEMNMKKRRERERESEAAGELLSALRMLGDGFMRMEQQKMETAREMEKARMEMELKRTERILDSQRCILDAFLKGLFGGKKRAKSSPES